MLKKVTDNKAAYLPHISTIGIDLESGELIV